MSQHLRRWRAFYRQSLPEPTGHPTLDDTDHLVLEYGAALSDAVEDLDELQRFFIAGQIQGESDRDRCAGVGLTYWQYRGRRLKTLAHLCRHLEGRHSARNSAPDAPVVT